MSLKRIHVGKTYKYMYDMNQIPTILKSGREG